jgi:hypothetical protein
LKQTFPIDPFITATIRFSTADVAESMRVTSWREYHGFTVLRADIEPAEGTSFVAAMISHSLPGLQLVSAGFTAARIIRTRETIADGNDDFRLFVNQTGDVTVSARGREISLQWNEAVLINSGEAVLFDRRSFGEALAIRIPRGTLLARDVDVDDAIVQRIPASMAAIDLLTCYVRRCWMTIMRWRRQCFGIVFRATCRIWRPSR